MKNKVALIIASHDTNLIDTLIELKSFNYKIVIVSDLAETDYISRFADVIYHHFDPNKEDYFKVGLQYIQNHYPNYTIVMMNLNQCYEIDEILNITRLSILHPDSYIMEHNHKETNIVLHDAMGSFLKRIIFYMQHNHHIRQKNECLSSFQAENIPLILSLS